MDLMKEGDSGKEWTAEVNMKALMMAFLRESMSGVSECVNEFRKEMRGVNENISRKCDDINERLNEETKVKVKLEIRLERVDDTLEKINEKLGDELKNANREWEARLEGLNEKIESNSEKMEDIQSNVKSVAENCEQVKERVNECEREVTEVENEQWEFVEKFLQLGINVGTFARFDLASYEQFCGDKCGNYVVDSLTGGYLKMSLIGTLIIWCVWYLSGCPGPPLTLHCHHVSRRYDDLFFLHN